MGQLTALFINDFDTSDLGLIVERAAGWADAPATRDRTTQLPTRVGAVILAPDAETAPRRISVDGVVKRTSVSAVRSAILELQERLYRGTIEVRFNDDPDKFVLARCESKVVEVTPPQFMNPRQRVRFDLFCPDPLIYDRVGSVVGLTTSRAATPLGTAPSTPLIRIMGAATNPVLTYRNMAGTSKQTMGFTVTLAATDYLEIDTELFTINKFVSGVKSNGIALLTSGDFILLDPQDGDYAGGTWPTLELNAGTGETLYRRAWL